MKLLLNQFDRQEIIKGTRKGRRLRNKLDEMRFNRGAQLGLLVGLAVFDHKTGFIMKILRGITSSR